MMWLPDGEKFRRYLYSLYDTIHERDGDTDTHRMTAAKMSRSLTMLGERSRYDMIR